MLLGIDIGTSGTKTLLCDDRGKVLATAMAEHGISAPGRAHRAAGPGPVALTLIPARRAIACPRCGARAVELTSEFGPTACKAMYRCAACLEPFEHVKEI